MITQRNNNQSKPAMPFILGVLVGAIVLGSLVGFGIAQVTASQNGTGTTVAKGPVEKAAGIKDKSTFKDHAEGILKEGGIEDEGSFHLQRPGGESQNVYLTSSTVDLSAYVGKKVEVWGQTFAAEKAGWLMDVGYVEVK